MNIDHAFPPLTNFLKTLRGTRMWPLKKFKLRCDALPEARRTRQTSFVLNSYTDSSNSRKRIQMCRVRSFVIDEFSENTPWNQNVAS